METANKDLDDDYMLSTFDNPFNPFEDFEIWWKFDMLLGHDTCGTLAREANTSPIFSDEVNEISIDRAVDYLCESQPFLFRKVWRSDFER